MTQEAFGMNRARGEVALEIAGKAHTLCLTLGALAEIETALEAESFAGLEERMARLKASDLVAILGALLRGGGYPYTDEEVRALKVELGTASRAIAEAFAAAGLSARERVEPPGEERAPRGRGRARERSAPGGASSAMQTP
jgi:hypothetical protein